MFISSGLLFVGIIYLILTPSSKQTKIKCLQFQQYAKEFPLFWITAQDKVDCDGVGITVNAPIH